MRDFGDDVFEGTARYYTKYRPSYPQQLFNDIVNNLHLNGTGRLLDLGLRDGRVGNSTGAIFWKDISTRSA
jgi:hypothetical protein